MASNSFSFRVTEAAFFCEESSDDVDGDSFHISSVNPSVRKWIKSSDNKFLILNEEEKFQIEDRSTDWQESHPEYKFSIQIYKSDNKDQKMGRAVMLYINKGGKKKFMCCDEKSEIHPVEMDLPCYIEESAHRAVWYRRAVECQTSWYMFESSLYPSKFLGLQSNGDEGPLSKLVLHHKNPDEVDDCCHIILAN